MNEKLWNEFLKTPQTKKEKETLGEAVVAVFKELGESINEASLGVGELKKRENLKLFISKIENGEAFELNDGTEVFLPLNLNSENIEILKTGEIPSRLRFNSTDGETIYLGNLKKTREFLPTSARGAALRLSNKGDTIEGLLAAAMFVSLTDKNPTKAKIIKTLSALNQGPNDLTTHKKI